MVPLKIVIFCDSFLPLDNSACIVEEHKTGDAAIAEKVHF
jgi:hypothetical protein